MAKILTELIHGNEEINSLVYSPAIVDDKNGLSEILSFDIIPREIGDKVCNNITVSCHCARKSGKTNSEKQCCNHENLVSYCNQRLLNGRCIGGLHTIVVFDGKLRILKPLIRS